MSTNVINLQGAAPGVVRWGSLGEQTLIIVSLRTATCTITVSF